MPILEAVSFYEYFFVLHCGKKKAQTAETAWATKWGRKMDNRAR